MKAGTLAPRKKDGKLTFDLVIHDGNTPLVKIKEGSFKDLNEVLEMLNKKL
jgi:hypothetical protein